MRNELNPPTPGANIPGSYFPILSGKQGQTQLLSPCDPDKHSSTSASTPPAAHRFAGRVGVVGSAHRHSSPGGKNRTKGSGKETEESGNTRAAEGGGDGRAERGKNW